jgi:hypothetical protein
MWTSYFTRVCVLQNKETQRESCILQGFVCLRINETQRESHILRGSVCFRIKKHNTNHVFYEGLCASEKRNAAWITYFTRFWPHRKPSNMPRILIWSGFWKWLCAIKVLVWKRRFCGRDRGGPRTAPRKQMNRENSMGVLLTDKKML